jgi:hypothetical protein
LLRLSEKELNAPGKIFALFFFEKKIELRTSDLLISVPSNGKGQTDGKVFKDFPSTLSVTVSRSTNYTPPDFLAIMTSSVKSGSELPRRKYKKREKSV